MAPAPTPTPTTIWTPTDTNRSVRPEAHAMPDADWWRQAVVYQIYPRSFADSNADGIGDLRGIISRIDYLAALGVDAVWLSPFYPSALADGGYDVDDYRDVDPRIGTLADFDTMIDQLHARGIKLIIDIVPNHSSDRHVWFQQALAAGPGAPERDRYLFRDGRGDHGELPPSDWESIFGGPAWTRVDDGQWYLHLFATEQPDWNWRNADVAADFLHTLKFWGDRGVDGFRIDVAHALTKDLPDELPDQARMQDHGAFPEGAHPIWDRDEVQEIYAEWRRLFDSYDPPLMAVAEAWVPAHRRIRYAGPQSLGQAFNFDLLEASWSAEVFRSIITENLSLAQQSGASSTWVFSNHDVIRHATRFGLADDADSRTDSDAASRTDSDADSRTDSDAASRTDSDANSRSDSDSDADGDTSGALLPATGRRWLRAGGPADRENRALGLARARAATLLSLALPGSAYLYQGEELGLPEVARIPADQRQDPEFFRTGGEQIGRDGCRVPLPWTADGPSYGFGDGPAHLPQPDWFGQYAVAVEDGDPDSTLQLYRRAVALRHRLQTAEEFSWLESDGQLLAFARPGGWVCVTNFADEAVALPAGDVLISSDQNGREGELPAAATVWLQRS